MRSQTVRKIPLSCFSQFSPGHSQGVEVCAGKYGIQSILVFLQTPVSDLSIPKLALDNSEYVLYFAVDRRFLLFNITGSVNGVVTYFGKSAETQVDTVVNGG